MSSIRPTAKHARNADPRLAMPPRALEPTPRMRPARVAASRRPPGRESLLQAAAQLFAEVGYDAVTTRQILERAGVEAPSLYHHFGSKLGLYRAVLGAAADPFLERFDRVASEHAARGTDIREHLTELIWTIFRGAVNNPEGVQISLFEAHRLGTRRLDVLVVWGRMRNVFVQALNRGVTTGELRIPRGMTEMAANLFIGGLTVYLQAHFAARPEVLTRRLARQITNLLLDGLAPRTHDA